jgi:predicted aconitase with swiveling domain
VVWYVVHETNHSHHRAPRAINAHQPSTIIHHRAINAHQPIIHHINNQSSLNQYFFTFLLFC